MTKPIEKNTTRRSGGSRILASLREAVDWVEGKDVAVRVTTVDVPVVDVKATRQRLGRRGSGRGGRLNFGPFASGRGNFGFDLGHSQLIKVLGLSVGLNVFQPVGRGSQSSDKVGDTEDNHGGLSIALDHKAVVVLGGAVHNLAELGSGGDGGNFFVIPSAWVID